MKIYFDNVLIDQDYYASITNSFKLFEEKFRLGVVASNSFNIEVPASYGKPEEVIIKIDDVDYAHLIVDNYEIIQNNMASIDLVDKMVLFDFNYDYSNLLDRYEETEDTTYLSEKTYFKLENNVYVQLIEGTDYEVGEAIIGDIYEHRDYATPKVLLQDMCSRVGLELGTNSFINDSIEIRNYDNTITAREYLSYIAELNGGYAIIGTDGKLYLKHFGDNYLDLDAENCEEFTIGEQHTIERIVYDNGLLKFESSISEDLETLYLNSSNMFITSQSIFNNIVNQIRNFSYYNFNTNNCIPELGQAGDILRFHNEDDTYNTIYQYDLDFNVQFAGSIDLQTKSQLQAETEVKGQKEIIRDLKTKVDRGEARLDVIAEEVGEYENRIATLEVSSTEIVEEVRAKVNQDEYNAYVEETATKINQTSDLIRSEVSKIITGENSIQKVETTGTILDQNGLTVYREGSDTQTVIDDKGISVESGGSILLKAKIEDGDSVIESKYLKVDEYLAIGTRSRIEDYDENYEPYTGVFWIGD